MTLTDLPTAPLVAAGLIGGFALANGTGNRPLGGVVMAASTALAAPAWQARGGLPTAAGLAAVQWSAMGVSHPLAKRIGAWPSVLTVASAAALAAHLVGDRRR